MRVVLGILAMVLGIVGVLACVAADVQTWRITGRVADTARRGTERADQGLQNVEGALTRVESTVTVTTVALADARRRVEAIDTKNQPHNAKLQGVLVEVKPYLERVNAVADVIASLAVLLENTAVLLEQGDNPPRVEGLHSAATDLSNAAGELHSIIADIDKSIKASKLLTAKTLIDRSLAGRGPPGADRRRGRARFRGHGSRGGPAHPAGDRLLVLGDPHGNDRRSRLDRTRPALPGRVGPPAPGPSCSSRSVKQYRPLK